MAVQPQIVLGNGALTTSRFGEIPAASLSLSVRIAKSDDAPLPPPADFDPRFGSQVNFTLYEAVAKAVMFFGNVDSEDQLNGATVPALFLLFYNKGGDFYLNPFGLRSSPYRLFDAQYLTSSGALTWQGLAFESVPPGEAPRYFDVLFSRDASISDIQYFLNLIVPHSIIR